MWKSIGTLVLPFLEYLWSPMHVMMAPMFLVEIRSNLKKGIVMQKKKVVLHSCNNVMHARKDKFGIFVGGPQVQK